MAYRFEDLVNQLEGMSCPFGVPADEWAKIQQGAKDLLTRIEALEAQKAKAVSS
jgi:hypothetical protein